MVCIFVCLLQTKEGKKFIVSSRFILDQKEMNRPQYRREWKKEVKKQFKVSEDKDVTIWKQWNFIGWTARGRGSILWPQPAVHIPWAVLTWHPINHTLPPPHPPPPHYNPHHPFLQSSCVNPGVALPLGCGLAGTEADAGICGQNSL